MNTFTCCSVVSKSVSMGLLNPSNIYEESWLLLWITKLLGLYPIQCCRFSCITYAYAILLLILYYSLLANTSHYTANIMDNLDLVTTATKIRKVRSYTNLIILPVILISSMHYGFKVKAVYEEIDNTDKNLKFLNTEIDYKWSMKRDVVRVTTVILIVILFNLLDYYTLINNDTNYMLAFMWIGDRFPDFVNSLLICSFASILNKIAERFQEINRIINSLTKENNFISVYSSSEMNNASRLKLVRLLHLKLCKAVAVLNEAYGFQFIILSILYIVYISFHINVVYNTINNLTDVSDMMISLLWGLLDAVKLAHIIRIYRMFTIQHT